jgi:RNA:NAD 2'-phosphotransferase (TPT1/KptA family)
MLSEKETTRRSKLLSLVLRHDPAHIGLSLDEQGWANVPTLLAQLAKHQQPLTLEELEYIVKTSPKQRFRFSDDRRRIRASQGHSAAVPAAVPALRAASRPCRQRLRPALPARRPSWRPSSASASATTVAGFGPAKAIRWKWSWATLP